MHGVTAAIVAFIFVCIVFPHLVRNRPQFYGALTLILLIILLDAAAMMSLGSEGRRSAFSIFAYTITALFQVAAILLLVLSTGGQSPRELASDMKRAYEVMRRGETEKEIIIPITGDMPRRPQPGKSGPAHDDDPDARVVYNIDDPSPPRQPRETPKENPGGPIPLE